MFVIAGMFLIGLAGVALHSRNVCPKCGDNVWGKNHAMRHLLKKF